KFILGLALDFVILAERLSDGNEQDEFEPELDLDQIFARYQQVTHRGEDDLATLTLTDSKGNPHGIRKTEVDNIVLFKTDLSRSNYPSAEPHNTGQWHRFKPLLERAFKLSK